jgi:preprotein translocase subunit SecA
VSTEDDLMRIYGGERIASIMDRLKVDEDTPIESKMITKSLEGAQKKVEGFNFDQRKNVVQYDDVMNRHRRAIYAMRREVLRAEDISARIKKMFSEEVDWLTKHPESTGEMYEAILMDSFPFDGKTLDKLFDSPADKFQNELDKAALKLYGEQEKLFSPEIMRKVERDIFLQVLDNLWMQHLENMDHLREGIHWISVGQRDPLVEYRRQGGMIFDQLQETLRHEIVRAISHAQPADISTQQAVDTELTRAAQSSVDNAGQITRAELYDSSDFKSEQKQQAEESRAHAQRKRARKAERQRKKKTAPKKKKRK